MWKPSRLVSKGAYVAASLVAVAVVLGMGQVISKGIFEDRNERIRTQSINIRSNQTQTGLTPEQFSAAASAINKTLPNDIDNEIRIESVKAFDTGLEYMVTLKQFMRHAKLTKEQKQNIDTLFAKNFCSSENTKILIKYGANFRYIYKSSDLFTLHIQTIDNVSCAFY